MRLWRDTGGAMVASLRGQRDTDYDNVVLPWARTNGTLRQRVRARGRLMFCYRTELLGFGGWPRNGDR